MSFKIITSIVEAAMQETFCGSHFTTQLCDKNKSGHMDRDVASYSKTKGM